MKKLFKLIGLLSTIFILSGCFKMDNFEGIEIYTTSYPIEYITTRLYGEHSTIKSIYPDGIIIDNYKLTAKQIKDYSSVDLFIFNGLTTEKDYVVKMFNHNKNLKIIDTTASMEFDHNVEELWLDPSNFLMLAQNIRTGFKEYITNHYLVEEIDNNYENLKIEISNIDAKLKTMAEHASNNTIVVASDAFQFLSKYNLKVISLEENDSLTEKTINDVITLINNGQINYIFVNQNEETNDTVKKIQDETNVKLLEFNPLSNINENDRNNKKDYITIMNDNLELLKQELY